MSESTPRMQWPYPSREDDPWYDFFQDYVLAADASGFAHREDRSIIWAGGGTLTWTLGTETLDWTGVINVYSPIGAHLLQIAAGSIDEWADGEVVYVVLTRQPLENLTATLVKASQLPSSDNAMSFAVRIGDVIYFRTGISLGDGDTADGVAPVPGGGTATDPNAIHVNVAAEIAGIALKGVPTGSDLLVIEDAADSNNKKRVTISTLPGLSTDRYGAGVIIGNSPNGDTADVCHVLDAGDGVLLKSAIESAGPGTDVLVRPGVYDFTSGAVVAPITIPAGVRVRGAGRGHTFIVTHATGDQRAFRLSAESELWDVTANVSLPTGPCTSATVIELAAERAEAHRVKVGLLGVYTITEANWSSLTSCFGMDPTGFNSDAKVIDCEAGDRSNPMPSFVDIAGKPLVNGLAAVQQGLISGPDENGFIVDRLISHGGDIGVQMDRRIRLLNSSIYNPFVYGVWCAATWAQICKNEIQMTVLGGPGDVGIYLDTAAECDVEGNVLYDLAPSGIGAAIGLNNSTSNRIRANQANFGWQYGIDISAGSNTNIALLNQMAGATTPYRDLGAGNDLAHNF